MSVEQLLRVVGTEATLHSQLDFEGSRVWKNCAAAEVWSFNKSRFL
jgi:hypothetical protein